MTPLYRFRWWWGMAVLLGLSACSTCPAPPTPEVVTRTITQTVQVAVPTYREPPAELMAPLKVPCLPTFVPAAPPPVTSGLTPAEESCLRQFAAYLKARDAAWRAWAKETP
jgi:hypothetical protein